MTDTLPTVNLPGGETVPAFGLGTWHMGEDRRRAPTRPPPCGSASSSA